VARSFDRFLSSFTCQASAAISADADSGGAKTEFDTTAGDAFMDGCREAEIEIDVTSAPASVARCKIYMEPVEHDGAGNSAPKLMGSVQIETTADKYTVRVTDLSEKGYIFLHAVDAGFTASASMRGMYVADT
jgi:hypothetical protein